MGKGGKDPWLHYPHLNVDLDSDYFIKYVQKRYRCIPKTKMLH